MRGKKTDISGVVQCTLLSPAALTYEAEAVHKQRHIRIQQ